MLFFAVTASIVACYFIVKARPRGKSYSYVDARFVRSGKDFCFLNFCALLILDKGVCALLMHRISQRIGSKVASKIITRVAEFLTGIEIYGNVEIGKGVEIWHGNGVVIGQSAKVGDNCLILQQVTIGGGFVKVGSNCKLGAGAKVLGNIELGDNVVVGANSVVTQNISDGTLVAGVPAIEIRKIESSSEIVFGTKSE